MDCKLSITRNEEDHTKCIAAKTTTGISVVQLQSNTYKSYNKIHINERLDKEEVSAFSYLTSTNSKNQDPTLLIGYKTGQITVYSQGKSLNTLNWNENPYLRYHKQPVMHLLSTPDKDEILAVFNDSSVIKFNITSQAVNPIFTEKLKKFKNKISFYKPKKANKNMNKIRSNISQGKHIDASNPEFSNFYMINHDGSKSNPRSFYKFNTSFISDAIVIEHERFRKNFLKNAEGKGNKIFAFVDYNGYFVVFDYETMKPLFSLKGYFGGYNSLSFSPDCEYVALGGHDDCITLLHINSLSVARLVGHRSFVSRAIFQAIPTELFGSKGLGETFYKNPYLRVIGGSMDGTLSFYEVEKASLEGNMNAFELQECPTSISLQNMSEPIEIKPLCTHKIGEAIGWIEQCGNLLVSSLMDGIIVTHQIQTSKEVSNKEREEEEIKTHQDSKTAHETPKMVDKLQQMSVEDEEDEKTNFDDEINERRLAEVDSPIAKNFETKLSSLSVSFRTSRGGV